MIKTFNYFIRVRFRLATKKRQNHRLWWPRQHVPHLSIQMKFQSLLSPLRIWVAVRRHLASPVCIMATSIVTRSVSLLLTSASNRNTPISAFSALARSVILLFYESLHKMYDASVHISNINSLFGLSDVLFESKSSVEDDPRYPPSRIFCCCFPVRSNQAMP